MWTRPHALVLQSGAVHGCPYFICLRYGKTRSLHGIWLYGGREPWILYQILPTISIHIEEDMELVWGAERYKWGATGQAKHVVLSSLQMTQIHAYVISYSVHIAEFLRFAYQTSSLNCRKMSTFIFEVHFVYIQVQKCTDCNRCTKSQDPISL